MKPVYIEVVSNLCTTLGHCRHCDPLFQESGLGPKVRSEDTDAYPPQFHEEWKRLREILQELGRLYRHRIVVRLVDADSPLGLYKALRHRFRGHPAFILDHKEVYTGWDLKEIEMLLDSRLKKGQKQRARPEGSPGTLRS
jgi:hypothetical protein